MTIINSTSNGVSASTESAPLAAGSAFSPATQATIQVSAADFAKLMSHVEMLTKLVQAPAPTPVAAPVVAAPVPAPAPAAPAAADPTAFATAIATAVALALKDANEPKKKNQSLADGLGTVLHGDTQNAVAKAAQAVVIEGSEDDVAKMTKVIANYGATAKLLCEVEEAQNRAVRNCWPWFLRGLVPVL